MNKTAKLLLAAAFAVSGLTAQAETLAEIDTNYGTIKLSLDEQRAPKTVANFVRYAEKGFYNNTVFHRVIDGFMIQGGGFTADLAQKSTDKAISNEAGNGLKTRQAPSPWRAPATRIPPPANSLSTWPTTDF